MDLQLPLARDASASCRKMRDFVYDANKLPGCVMEQARLYASILASWSQHSPSAVGSYVPNMAPSVLNLSMPPLSMPWPGTHTAQYARSATMSGSHKDLELVGRSNSSLSDSGLSSQGTLSRPAPLASAGCAQRHYLPPSSSQGAPLEVDDDLLRIFEDMSGGCDAGAGEMSSIASDATAVLNNSGGATAPSLDPHASLGQCQNSLASGASTSPLLAPLGMPLDMEFTGFVGPSLDSRLPCTPFQALPPGAFGLGIDAGALPMYPSAFAAPLPPSMPALGMALPPPSSPLPRAQSLPLRPAGAAPRGGATSAAHALKVRAGGVSKSRGAAPGATRSACIGATTEAPARARVGGNAQEADDAILVDADADLLANNNMCQAISWMDDMNLPSASLDAA